EAVEHLGQFSVGRTASTGSVFGQRQQGDAMCGYYPQIIMDKRQYKLTRLYPKPETAKIAGKCCSPIGRSTILTESNTEFPLPGYKDFGYGIFRKRDCCGGATLSN
ncbi:TraU family protein, partial [Pseudomonas monteilii]|uniref:TraU family protein n=1 Tax=Pseudomonas monteilii TaxID=76759 RepID=UPI001E52975A